MNKSLFIYGLLLPIIILTSIISKTVLISWFVVLSFTAIFHDFIFNTKTVEVTR